MGTCYTLEDTETQAKTKGLKLEAVPQFILKRQNRLRLHMHSYTYHRIKPSLPFSLSLLFFFFSAIRN